MFSVKLWPPLNFFLVAGSRQGNFQRPKWCFTHNLIDPTMVTINAMTGDWDPTHFNVMLSFKESKIYAWNDFLSHFLCESVN
jgi:hypothetical protein